VRKAAPPIACSSVSAPNPDENSDALSRRLLSLTAFAAALVSAFSVATWATRASFGAKFGPIDDHEQLIWMGPDGHLPWSQFWSTFIDKTEVGHWGHTGRFRPAYYFLRVGETVVFGDHPRAWYAGVLVLFAIACALLGYTASLWLWRAVDGTPAWLNGPAVVISAAVGSFLFAGLYAWSGIVGRLGPAELLGLAAAGVVLLSLTKLSLGCPRWWWIPALLGVTASTFSKESFFSLGLAFPLVGTYSYLSFGRRQRDLVAGFAGLLPAALLALILAPTLLHSQHDVYGTSIGGSRFSAALSALDHAPLRRSLDSVGVLLLAWLAIALTLPADRRRLAGFLLAIVVWLFSCVFLDDWFYGGSYPLPRYRALPDLVITVQLIGAVCLSIAAVRRARGALGPVAIVAVVSLALSSLFVLRLLPASDSNLHLTRATAVHNATTSDEYQSGLSKTLARLAAQHKPPVAVVAAVGSDYEPAFAVLNELARQTRDGLHEYLIVVGPSARTDPGLATLDRISRRGQRDWHTRPVGELARKPGAVCVFLNERPYQVAGCRRGDAIRLVAAGM
jgi:hypothetical protein